MEIGRLRLSGSKDDLLRGLMDKMISMLLTNGVEYLLIALLFIIIFHQSVARHLKQFVQYIHAQDEDQPFKPYLLKRSQMLFNTPDELNDVVEAYNAVNGKLHESLKRLKENELNLLDHKLHLEKKVEEKTFHLKNEIDIRKTSEASLRESEEELENQKNYLVNVLESLTHPFYVVDTKTLSVVVANSAAKRIGIEAGEKCYTCSHNKAEPCTSVGHDCPLDSLLEKKKPVVVEHRHQGADGNPVYVEVHGFPIFDQAGHVVQMIEYALDVTDRKLMEEHLLEAKQEAETANRAKSNFLANMSHELRTPLNSIIGFAQVLERQIGKKLDERQMSHFRQIVNGGEHLLEMVNDILDLSKIEAGKIELEFKPFDLEKMLQRAPDFVRSMANHKNLRIKEDIEPSLGWLNGDETRLKQVVFNLLSNAVKFTEPGGTIGITARGAGDQVQIDIWDEGIGIPESHLELIFDPFEQVKESKQTKEKGTGLGLAISKRLVQLHQGDLNVSSQLGEGSCFRIILPGRIADQRATDTESSETYDSPDTHAMENIRILVTEDSESNRQLIEALLEPLGCQLDYAMTGEDAVAMAFENPYDLILMDIQLPEMDGVEAMKQIRKGLKERLPIIALTAFAMQGDEERYLDRGFDDYISKPIDVDALFTKLQLHLNLRAIE